MSDPLFDLGHDESQREHLFNLAISVLTNKKSRWRFNRGDWSCCIKVSPTDVDVLKVSVDSPSSIVSLSRDSTDFLTLTFYGEQNSRIREAVKRMHDLQTESLFENFADCFRSQSS